MTQREVQRIRGGGLFLLGLGFLVLILSVLLLFRATPPASACPTGGGGVQAERGSGDGPEVDPEKAKTLEELKVRLGSVEYDERMYQESLTQMEADYAQVKRNFDNAFAVLAGSRTYPGVNAWDDWSSVPDLNNDVASTLEHYKDEKNRIEADLFAAKEALRSLRAEKEALQSKIRSLGN
jgi:hypothetical protein